MQYVNNVASELFMRWDCNGRGDCNGGACRLAGGCGPQFRVWGGVGMQTAGKAKGGDVGQFVASRAALWDGWGCQVDTATGKAAGQIVSRGSDLPQKRRPQ